MEHEVDDEKYFQNKFVSDGCNEVQAFCPILINFCITFVATPLYYCKGSEECNILKDYFLKNKNIYGTTSCKLHLPNGNVCQKIRSWKQDETKFTMLLKHIHVNYFNYEARILAAGKVPNRKRFPDIFYVGMKYSTKSLQRLKTLSSTKSYSGSLI